MKLTYEKRWGHPRTHKAVKHLARKALKRIEAEMRNEKWNRLTMLEKRAALIYRPGHSKRQMTRLGFAA